MADARSSLTPSPLSRTEAERLLEAVSAALALPIPPLGLPGTLDALVRLSEAAALLLAFPLGERDEPAPVFRP